MPISSNDYKFTAFPSREAKTPSVQILLNPGSDAEVFFGDLSDWVAAFHRRWEEVQPTRKKTPIYCSDSNMSDNKPVEMGVEELDIILSFLLASEGHDITFKEILYQGKVYTDISDIEFFHTKYESEDYARYCYSDSNDTTNISLRAKRNGSDVNIHIFGVYIHEILKQALFSPAYGIIETSQKQNMCYAGMRKVHVTTNVNHITLGEACDSFEAGIFANKKENGITFSVFFDNEYHKKISIDKEKIILHSAFQSGYEVEICQEGRFWGCANGEDIVFEKNYEGKYVYSGYNRTMAFLLHDIEFFNPNFVAFNLDETTAKNILNILLDHIFKKSGLADKAKEDYEQEKKTAIEQKEQEKKAVTEQKEQEKKAVTEQKKQEEKATATEDIKETASKEREPVEKILVQKEKILKKLKSAVKGQDMAVEKFMDGYIRYALNGKKKGKPAACYLFAGPPGVGKTFLAEQFVSVAEEEGYKYKRFDMAAYGGGSSDKVTGLVGFESSWRNAQPGQLTEFVMKNPKCVLLFDEIEKASSSVKLLFLSILEGATLTDKYYNEPVSFEEAIIIFTTNEGKDLYEDNRNVNLTLLPDTAVIEGLRASNFAPELLSRFASANIIVFNHMDYTTLTALIEGKNGTIDKTINLIKEQHNLKFKLEYDKNLSKLYLLSKGNKADARFVSANTAKLTENYFINAADYLSRKQHKAMDTVDKIIVKADINDSIREYFELPGNQRVLKFTADDGLENPGSFMDCTSAKNASEFKRLLADCNWSSDKKEDKYDAIIIDAKQNADNEDWHLCLDAAGKIKQNIPVIILNDDIDNIDDKESVIKLGATDFVERKKFVEEKMFNPLRPIIERYYFAKKTSALVNSGKRIAAESKFEYNDKDNSLTLRFTNLHITKAAEDNAQERRENKRYMLTKRPQAKLSDVFGSELLKGEIMRCVDNIKNPDLYKEYGIKPMTGVLMYGAPGMGKTMLAKAIAYEAKTSDSSPIGFISTAGSDFVNPNGVAEMEEVFKIARRNRPCVIFIDEFDAISKRRSNGSISPMAEAVLEKFLKEMDGLESDNNQVYVIAATNYSLDDLDEAVTRRFSSKINVPYPSLKEREMFLRFVLEKQSKKLLEKAKTKVIDISDEKEIATLNKMLAGATNNYAEIEQFINESISEAIFERSKRENTLVDFKFLCNRIHNITNGAVNDERDKEKEKVTAYHEAGHAVLMHMFGRKIDYVTIISRSGYGGYALSDREFSTDKDFREQICISLGGRAAEKLLREKYKTEDGINNTVGPYSDLQNATNYAYDYVCRYGLSGRLLVVPDKFAPMQGFSKAPALAESVLPASENEAIWNEVKQLLEQQEKHTEELLRNAWDELEALANTLLNVQELTGEQVEKVICEKKVISE